MGLAQCPFPQTDGRARGSCAPARRCPDPPVTTFRDVGITLDVIWPGQPSGLYHAETNPEAFLVRYPNSGLARRHGAGVETETDSPREAYAPFPSWQPARPGLGSSRSRACLLGRPFSFAGSALLAL
jgi:hypothetical protein